MADFFISYNHRDTEYAEWVSWILEEAGYSVIYQGWDFGAGSNFVVAMDNASKNGDRVVPILSANFFKSNFTQAEWAAYFAQDPTGEKGLVVPIRVDDVSPEGLLKQIVYIDIFDIAEADAQERILLGIKQDRKKPKTKPSFPKRTTTSGKIATVSKPLPKKPQPKENPLAEPFATRKLKHIKRDDTPLNMEWCWIMGGKFTMGSDNGYDDEKPVHQVPVEGFWMGRYPVTNQQFQEFLQASGYKKEQWWIPAGWVWRRENAVERPSLWLDEIWNGDNQPVVGISWYEAYAYTQWASSVSGLEIALPTEAQWEKAARWTDKRTYPWGNDNPTKKLLNFAVNVGKTTDVGTYSELGDSPYGCGDMSGNVWEWCLSQWVSDYPYKADERNDVAGNSPRILRGGSWNSIPYNCRAVSRFNLNPLNRFNYFGFRVCVRRPPSL